MSQQEISAAFRRLRMRRTVASVIAGAVLLLLIVLGVQDLELWMRVAVAAVVGGGLLLFLSRDWRCPKCRQPLGRLVGGDACPHCGVPLTPEEAAKQAAKRADSGPRT